MFEEKSVIKEILEFLENKGVGVYPSDLTTEVAEMEQDNYNTDKEQELLDYDVFLAVSEVVTYEQDELGKVFTDFSKPYDVANVLFDIKARDIMWPILHELSDDEYNSEMTQKTVDKLTSALNQRLAKIEEEENEF